MSEAHRKAAWDDVDRALNATSELCRMTPRERAEQRMRQAKAAFSAAAGAAQRGAKNAGELADAALLELNAARAALRELDAAEEISR